ncbi:MAG TPA: Maf family protein [Clostridia bacterium]
MSDRNVKNEGFCSIMEQLILASQSPRRKLLLQQIGIPFSVFPSDVKEPINMKMSPDKIVIDLSEKKAEQVCGKLECCSEGPHIVLAADTIVVLDEVVMGKPKDPAEAFNMLEALSGRWHEVITGVTLRTVNTTNKIMTHAEKTKVKIRKLSKQTIQRYIDSGEPFDKAGAYGIQGLGALLVEKLHGCYYNVVGLPLYKVSVMLNDMGFKIL